MDCMSCRHASRPSTALAALLTAAIVGFPIVAAARGGDLDTTYGSAGFASLPSGSIVAFVPGSDGSSIAAIDASPRRLVRLRADGSLDPAFGTAGTVALDSGFPVVLQALAIQPDGHILVAGGVQSLTLSCQRLRVARLDTRGRLDSTFGSAGVWESACVKYESITSVNVAELADGRIQVFGVPYRFWSMELDLPLIARLGPDGNLDTAYGVAGMAPSPFPIPYDPPALAILDDGSMVIARYAPTSQGYEVWSSRLDAAGMIVPSGDGTSESRLQWSSPAYYGFRTNVFGDGTIVITAADPIRGDRAIVGRYLSDGRPLPGFGVEGVVQVEVPSNLRVTQASAAPDRGLLLVADGYFPLAHILIKLDEAGNPDPAFGTAGVRDLSTSPPSHVIARVSMVQDGYALLAGASCIGDVNCISGFVERIQVVGDVVEFYHAGLGHYFMAADDSESRGLDAGGGGGGWIRTGANYRPGGTRPLCRFYGTPGIGPNSHFYTAEAEECALVKHDPGWTFEGLAFYVTPVVNGACTPALRPVHRLYNNRWMHNDSNHRFVTDTALIASMTQAGWIHEGAVFCAKP